MRYFLDAGLLALYCTTALFWVKTDMSMVAAALCVVIMVCVCYVDGKKLVKGGIVILYGLLGIWYKDLAIFYPMMIYCAADSRVFWGGILTGMFGLYRNWESIPAAGVYGLLLGCVFAVVLRQNAEKYKGLIERLQIIKDDSEEKNMLLSEKNKVLQEKQDYEIYAATLKERNRIAREIHDNVGHVLSRSILLVGAAKAVNKDENMNAVLEGLDKSLNSAMDSIRSSVHDLHDEAVNLQEVLQGIVQEFTFCSVEFTYDMSETIPKEIKYCFISVIKEGLANVMRHSNATIVKIVVREHPALYQLCIEDNGEKTKKDPDLSDGIGLQNMQERVKTLHGNFRISNKSGYRIFITIPKHEKDKINRREK